MNDKFFIRSYAKAIFELSCEQQRIQDWENMLIVASRVSKNHKFCFLFYTELFSAQKIADIYIDVCGNFLDIYGKRLILLMAKYKRLLLLSDILNMFVVYRLRYENSRNVEVISAYVLTKKQKDSIIFFMENKFFSKVLLNCKIDKSIISGFIIRTEDMVLDYSITGCVQRLKSFLK